MSIPDHGHHYCYPLKTKYSDLLMCAHRGLARDEHNLGFPTCQTCPQFYHVLNLRDSRPIRELYAKKNEISRSRALNAHKIRMEKRRKQND